MSPEVAPRMLRIDTPDGVAVELELGGVAERLFAFLLDMLLVLLTSLLLLIAAAAMESWVLFGWMLSLSFVIRVFYFVWREAQPRAATFGKRRLGLRVVRADGGPLSLEAVLVRNFTRELEVFVPLAFVATADEIWPGHSALARLGASFWFLAVATMPLWSRSRVRLGDLVAGTRVVRTPRSLLLGDLARRTTPPAKDTAPEAPQFRPEQLSIYGIYELQVLEEVLRKARQPGGREAMAAVASRIRTKIDWDPLRQGTLGDEEFLQVFYAEQRRHLEQQLLFGKRKERRKQ